MGKILSHKESVFGIEPPISVTLKVIETEPGFAGNTSSGASKPATLETGAIVHVPLFINIGDTLEIDTRTGEYKGRA
jgi:elongation factor P